MPSFVTLLELAKWIQLLDDSGNVKWDWFFKPGDNVLGGMASDTTRHHMEAILQDLIGSAPLPFPADSNQNWMVFQVTNNVGAGVTWNTSGDLRMGLASDIHFALASQQIDLSLIVRLLHIDKPSLSFKADDLGCVKFTSKLPTPDFLQSIALDAEITHTPPQSIALVITDKDNPARVRTLDTSKFPGTRGWDCVRMLLFVLEAWFRKKDGTADFFNRVNAHLFPMFGEPPTNLTPQFPLFADIGQPADFKAWMDSIIKPGDPTDDASRILTFLWHLHALVTGNNSPSFFHGSPVYFPLNLVPGQTPGSDNPPSFPTPADKLPTSAGPGAYLGIDDYNGARAVVLLFKEDDKTSVMIPLVAEGGTRPPVTTDLSQLKMPAGSLTQTMSVVGNTVTFPPVTLFDPAALHGTYSFGLQVATGQPVTFVIGLPAGNLPIAPSFPPPAPEAIIGVLLHWILNTAGTMAGLPAKGVFDALAPVVDKGLSGNVLPADFAGLATAVVKAAASNLALPLGPLTLTLQWPVISAELKLDHLDIGAQTGDFRVGSMSLSSSVDCTNGSIKAASFGLFDVRLPNPGGAGATGLEAKLLPDLTSVPGFSIKVDWDHQKNPALSISGSAKIPVQKTIGPLNVGALYVQIDNTALYLGIDLALELGPVLISVQELGVRVTFQGPKIEPRLLGLGISLDADVVKLTGMFGKVDKTPLPPDYVGGAVLTVIDLFQLSAIGGYTQTVQGGTSIFVFAALNAPLGGPPVCFFTGIAVGFGYNRSLPPPGLLNDHPFMKVMRGDLKLGGDMRADLAQLSDYFAAADGVNWVAGGVQFISFGFIHGTIIVAVQFGQRFALDILGSASFAIEPIVYFEIDIEAAYDGEKFILVAKIAPSSYLIHPDIFRLEGSFALGIWNDGDFVLAIGGFHPCFQVPDRYNEAFHTLDRVGVKASVFGFINVSVECFFACTNHALMAGASVSLSADFDLIAAGLDIYVDVLICWDPFFILARMSVTVWFEFLGRHEIGVQLQIWTPQFGGTAHISLFIVSFDIDFGAALTNPPPKFAHFIAGPLGVPTQGDPDHPGLQRFNTADQAGLLRVDITQGRSSKDQEQGKSSEQEGVSTAIEVKPEFQIRVLSKLPLEAPSTPAIQSNGDLGIKGTLSVPLCKLPASATMWATLTVAATVTDQNKKSTKKTIPVADPTNADSLGMKALDVHNYPAAEFGGPLVTAAAGDEDARSQVASISNDPKDTVVQLVPGVTINWAAQPLPEGLPLKLSAQADVDLSSGADDYPIPLGLPAGQLVASRNRKGQIHAAPTGMVTIGRSKAAANPRLMRLVAMPTITQRTGSFGRTAVVARLRGSTLAKLPAGVAVIPPPASPPRSADVFGVSLRITRPHAVAPIGRVRPVAPVRMRRVRTIPMSLLPAPKPASVTVAPGAVAHFHVTASTVSSIKLTATGNQIVRSVCLNQYEAPIADVFLPAAQAAALPALTRRVICVGEGSTAPVGGGATPTALESIGIERDTTLLAIGGRTFAAHGCAFTCDAMLDEKPELLSTIPGGTILQKSSAVSVLFPAVPANWTLAIMVVARVSQPDTATDQIRWLSGDAVLGSLRTVVAGGRVAYLMPIAATVPWTLQVELGPQWRLLGIAACDLTGADLATKLAASDDWNLVDDRFEQPAPSLSADLTLEVVP